MVHERCRSRRHPVFKVQVRYPGHGWFERKIKGFREELRWCYPAVNCRQASGILSADCISAKPDSTLDSGGNQSQLVHRQQRVEPQPVKSIQREQVMPLVMSNAPEDRAEWMMKLFTSTCAQNQGHELG